MIDFTRKKFGVISLGCDKNRVDTEKLLSVIKARGCTLTDDIEEANVIIVNTCAFLNEARKEAIDTVLECAAYKSENLEKLVVCGCLPQKFIDELYGGLSEADVFLGTRDYDKFFGALEKSYGGERVNFVGSGDNTYMCDRLVTTPCHYAYLKIADGCNNFCTYCIVPYTRGRERSRHPESILRELADLRERGFKEVTLLGQNVNSYRFEGEDGRVTHFPDLLAMVAEAAPEMRVRFTTSHPKDMSDDTLRVIAGHSNLARHVHLPVQSGSDKVLKSMNRKYTRAWYLDRVAAIRRILPDAGISTDMFTGFHDETEEDFAETLSLMEEVGFDSAFMFKYSERPGTFASQHLPDNVAEETKIERLNRMIALQNDLSLRSNRADIGKEFEVLVEGRSKRSAEEHYGRTSQNKVVVFPKGDTKAGDFVKVRVTDASSATLRGELADS